ncbi:MAG TPA: CbtA family protein [Geminicoccaceae bacterium]|nr:CbtA family protein [Geminicoccus sp.]HMU51759.1 CbtA family protein [Geminicoccaceae bacterium]
MSLFRNVVLAAALTGLVVGLVLTAIQSFSTVPLILEAETYEVAEQHAAAGAPAHEHEEESWAPADGFPRFAFTLLANVVTAIGYALILIVAAELAGGIGGWRQGLLWGLAGFIVFTVAPGLGLPPELPGMPAGPLDARQLWWLATAAATAGGLALLFLRRNLPLAVAGLVLIVLPHLVGAPKPDSFATDVPEGLHHDFVVAVVVSSLVFWALLGGVAGHLRSRSAGTA